MCSNAPAFIIVDNVEISSVGLLSWPGHFKTILLIVPLAVDNELMYNLFFAKKQYDNMYC